MERFWNAAVATNDNWWRPEQDRSETGAIVGVDFLPHDVLVPTGV